MSKILDKILIQNPLSIYYDVINSIIIKIKLAIIRNNGKPFFICLIYSYVPQ
ncbi:MAG: hypothetical protein ACI9EK_002855 [Psychroserpens sp.]|jgi:hypothetical protein